MARDSLPNPFKCANCAAKLKYAYCPVCGQSRRGSQRLEARAVAVHFLEHLWDVDSAFARTFMGLWLRPGQSCLEYVRGRRKRYMNPFAYFLLASTVNLLATAALDWAFPLPASVADDEPQMNTLLLLAALIPWAATWMLFFRKAGFNLAEHYVFALFIMGQSVWFETLVTLPLERLLGESWVTLLLAAFLFTYPSFAGSAFYGEGALKTAAKMTSSLLLFMVVLAAAFALFGELPMEDVPPPVGASKLERANS